MWESPLPLFGRAPERQSSGRSSKTCRPSDASAPALFKLKVSKSCGRLEDSTAAPRLSLQYENTSSHCRFGLRRRCNRSRGCAGEHRGWRQCHTSKGSGGPTQTGSCSGRTGGLRAAGLCGEALRSRSLGACGSDAGAQDSSFTGPRVPFTPSWPASSSWPRSSPSFPSAPWASAWLVWNPALTTGPLQ